MDRNRRELQEAWVGVARLTAAGAAEGAVAALGPEQFRDKVFGAFLPPQRT